MIKNIASIHEVIDSANLPDDSMKAVSQVDDDELYKLIYRFYNERGDINPEKYTVKHDGDKKESKTILGRPEGGDMPIDSIEPLQFHHSHFSSEGLDVASIDRDKSWNGEKCGLMYENGILKAIKSDYYTTKSFGSIPKVEVAHAINQTDGSVEDVELDDLTARNKYLKSKGDVHRTRWLASGGSVGGVILANTGDTWKLILGRRSDRTNINPGRVSMIPNGALRYDNVTKDGFLEDLRLHFNEEMFRGQKRPNFFENFIESYRVSTGWNLRSGELAIGYALLINDPGGYNMIKELESYNFEFTEIVEIDVHDPEELTDKANIETMSPSVIPTVYRSIVLLENVVDDVELDYTIEQET